MRGTIANGSKVISLRRALGLTQEGLAAQAGCDVKTVRRAERSQGVDLGTLTRIGKCLGVNPRDIMAELPGPSPESNIEAVRNNIAAFNARDPQAFSECFTDDAILIVFADPSLPGTGEFRGKTRIQEWAQICFECFQTSPMTQEICHFRAVNDVVFVRIEQSVVASSRTGRETAASSMTEFTIRDGKIATMRMFPESGAMERLVLNERESI